MFPGVNIAGSTDASGRAGQLLFFPFLAMTDSFPTRSSRVLPILLLWGMLALMAAMVNAHAQQGNAPVGVQQLTQAQFVADDSATPPVTGWQALTLPDSWRQTRPGYSGFGWYRIPFQMEQVPQQPLMLYIPRVALAAEIWLNGSLLIPGVRYDDGTQRGADMSDAPLYLTLPSGLFMAGDNEFVVRLQGDADILSGLSAFSLGPNEALFGQWLSHDFLQMQLPTALLVLTLCILCFMGAYLRLKRGINLAQATGLAALLTVMIYGVIPLPGTRGDAEVVRAMTTTCLFWWLNLAGWRLGAGPGRWYPRLLHGLSVVTLVALGLLWAWSDRGDVLWLLTWPQQLIALPVVALLLLRAWQWRSFKLVMLALAAGGWLAILVYTKFIAVGWLPFDAVRLNRAGALPLCIVVLYMLVERFVLERDEAQRAQRQAISAERGRILQDMHDGMGSHLITALRLAQRDAVDRREVVSAIDDALQDMRLIIDSLDVQGHDLLPLLGNLRFRLEPRLNRLGVQMQWDVEPPPPLPYLTPDKALGVLRIVQEAINNVLKHSGATALRITVRPLDDAVMLRIEDNGSGFDIDAVAGGRGLSGMQRRAQTLGGRLDIEASQPGTRVTLHLPSVQG